MVDNKENKKESKKENIKIPLVEDEIPPSAKELAEEVKGLILANKDIQIRNNLDYERATEILKDISIVKKRIDIEKRGATKHLDAVHDMIVNWFRPMADGIATLEKTVKRSTVQYREEQDRIKKEAERKALLEAKEKQAKIRSELEAKAKEEERKRKEAEAARKEEERKRLAAEEERKVAERRIKELEEAQKKAELEAKEQIELEAERKRQEELKKSEEESSVKEQEYQTQEDDAKDKEESLKEEQELVFIQPDLTNVPKTPKANGLSIREYWDIEIIDSSLVPREYCTPDEVMIRQIVKKMKGQIKIPGVRIFTKKSASVRTK